MNRLRINLLIATSLITLGLTIGATPRAYADCAPQTEQISYWQGTDGAGFHDMATHEAPNPDCPVDFYSTSKEDDYMIGRVMPTFHLSADTQGNYDGRVFFLYPISGDFSPYNGKLYCFSIVTNETPYNVTIKGTDGYNDLSNKTQTTNANEAKVTWYALDGEDRIEGGSGSVDIAYGGLGNDMYSIWNNEDRAIESDDEGFDVAVIGTGAQNYRFDYKTSIEAIYLYEGGTVDMNYLPPGVIFLDRLVENRGGRGGGSISDYLDGTEGNDAIIGGDLNQIVDASSGTDFVDGGAGDDELDGGPDSDVMYGGSGNDEVYGGEGDDLIVGGSGEGNDMYRGGPGVDTVKYTSAKSAITINLLATKNQAYSTSGKNAAGIGVDQLSEIENVIAGNFNDNVTGNAFPNRLSGEKGDDELNGERANDALIGGLGSDNLTGGSEVDSFVYMKIDDSTPTAPDTIIDFDPLTEKINLSAIDASTLIKGNNAFLFNGGSAIGTSTQGEVSVKKVNKAGTANDYTLINIDTDADTAPEAVIRIKGLKTLTTSNFVL